MSSSLLSSLSSLKSSIDSHLSCSPLVAPPVLSLLEELSSFTPSINQEILLKTQIGLAVNKLTKVENSQIKAKAKSLVSEWKNLVLKQSASPVPATNNKRKEPEQTENTNQTENDQSKKNKVISIPSSVSVSSPAQASPASNGTKQVNLPSDSTANSNSALRYPAADEILSQTSDPVRSKIQRSLFDALGGSSSQHEAKLAVEIENEIFNNFGGQTNAQYRQKFRELAMNLKDKNNPDINENLLYGIWSPAEVVAKPVTELASQAMKEERKKERDWHSQEIRSDLDKNRGMTDMFRCGKCGERKCTYYQKQTRSADEPMTTFVNCTVNRNFTAKYTLGAFKLTNLWTFV
jgi:transcription elongation factor S-II